jgi:hypothetical protein
MIVLKSAKEAQGKERIAVGMTNDLMPYVSVKFAWMVFVKPQNWELERVAMIIIIVKAEHARRVRCFLQKFAA